MYSVGVSAEFSAAHFLAGYRGSCESVHGHNYRVEATVESSSLDRAGLSLDFRRLREALEEVLSGLDHRLLNDLPDFKACNPSSENIARHVAEELAGRLPDGDGHLAEVKVWETGSSWASWRP